MKCRTRIAPSPTGLLHIGHIRTSLYDYALAKKHGGQFILRVEDTDKNRYVEGAVEKILYLHKCMGLDWDEGPEVGGPHAPYVQSERLDLYREHAQKLIDDGFAYYCFCDEERLSELKKSQQEAGNPTTKYDKFCLKLSKEQIDRNLKEGKPHVIRLKIPENEIIAWHDEVLGDISVNSNDLDDQVLIKSDGYPTYHLAVVVDDHVMDVTHVIRGNDWIPSTPKHVLLYKYFGWELPFYVHLPNLKEVEGTQKLSKRYGAVAVDEFLKLGYLPEALLNYLMFMGWNPGTDKEIFSLKEFVNDFSIEKIQTSDLISFDRDKLVWLNGYYIRNFPTPVLYERIMDWSKQWDIKLESLSRVKDTKLLLTVLDLVKERMKTLADFELLTHYFFDDPHVDKSLFLEFSETEKKTEEIIKNYLELYKNTTETSWTRESLDKISHEALATFVYKPKEAFMSLRIAVTGDKATPPLFDVLEVLGKNVVIKRLENILPTLEI